MTQQAACVLGHVQYTFSILNDVFREYYLRFKCVDRIIAGARYRLMVHTSNHSWRCGLAYPEAAWWRHGE